MPLRFPPPFRLKKNTNFGLFFLKILVFVIFIEKLKKQPQFDSQDFEKYTPLNLNEYTPLDQSIPSLQNIKISGLLEILYEDHLEAELG